MPIILLTLFSMGLFEAAQECWETKKVPVTNICYRYPTMMKFNTAIPQLERINIYIYKSGDTLFDNFFFLS